jgi:methionine-rich copper-binding protein CopC
MRIVIAQVILAFVVLGVWPSAIWAHAFPVDAEPGAGATVEKMPLDIRIRFNAELEPIFSKLRVDNGHGHTVSEGEGHVDPSDSTLLLTHVPAVPPGTYHVYWQVVSHDGHRTQGDYTFDVQ